MTKQKESIADKFPSGEQLKEMALSARAKQSKEENQIFSDNGFDLEKTVNDILECILTAAQLGDFNVDYTLKNISRSQIEDICNTVRELCPSHLKITSQPSKCWLNFDWSGDNEA